MHLHGLNVPSRSKTYPKMYRPEETEMDVKLKFKVSELVTTIKKNRDEHEEIYKESMEGYRKKLVEELEKKLADAKEGKDVSHHIDLYRPTNNLDDYDNIILYLDMAKDEYVELSTPDFNRYVRDQWNWKKEFLSSNSVFSSKARASYYEGS